MYLYAFLQGVPIKRSYPREAVVSARTGAQWEACLHSDVTTSKAESVKSPVLISQDQKKKKENIPVLSFLFLAGLLSSLCLSSMKVALTKLGKIT